VASGQDTSLDPIWLPYPKWLCEENLQIDEKREAKGKGEKQRYTRLNVEFQRIARRDKKAFLNNAKK